MQQPTLETEQLILRPFVLEDASDVQRLAGAEEVAATTFSVPYPYEDGIAEQWILTHAEEFAAGKSVHFAIVVRKQNILCGSISLGLSQSHFHAVFSPVLYYWVGVPYCNRGYAAEAAQAILEYGFEVLNLHRIYARHLKTNAASGRVLQKVGMVYEGCQRDHIRIWGQLHDVENYGLLAEEWRAG